MRADIILCGLRVEAGHTGRLFPGIPAPQADEPLVGFGRDNAAVLQGARRADPVGHQGFDGFHSRVFVRLVHVCVVDGIDIALPTLAVFHKVAVAAGQHVRGFVRFLCGFFIGEGKALRLVGHIGFVRLHGDGRFECAFIGERILGDLRCDRLVKADVKLVFLCGHVAPDLADGLEVYGYAVLRGLQRGSGGGTIRVV